MTQKPNGPKIGDNMPTFLGISPDTGEPLFVGKAGQSARGLRDMSKAELSLLFKSRSAPASSTENYWSSSEVPTGPSWVQRFRNPAPPIDYRRVSFGGDKPSTSDELPT